MKHVKLSLLSFILSAMVLTGCGCSSDNGGGGDDDPQPYEGKVTVKFYIDFNQASTTEVYSTAEVDNGSLVAEPTKPTTAQAPLPEFPVFLGWSKKEIVDDKKDLWNFSTDKIEAEGDTFAIFGIWVAEGEN